MPRVSDLSLKVSYWLVSHRQQFKRWWFIALLAADFLLIVYVAVILTIYVTDTAKVQNLVGAMPRQVLADNYRAAHQPVELVIDDPQVLARGDARFDLAARIDNLNDQWVALVHYTFKADDQSVTSGTSYISSASTAYLIGLNVSPNEDLTLNQGTIEVEIDSIDWTFTPSQSNWMEPSFLVSDTQITSNDDAGQSATVVTAKVMNNAVVGWSQVSVNVVLTIGDQIVGVNQFTVRDWLSLTEQTVTVQWRRSFSGSLQVNVLPVVNVFDQSQYIR
ncbi:MAG: hypothetical protein V1838_01625 [Patescibacteria group bacterium]